MHFVKGGNIFHRHYPNDDQLRIHKYMVKSARQI